eukprot:g11042.t1
MLTDKNSRDPCGPVGSTPCAAAELNDTLVSIEVNFTDEDLDYNELGGNITWVAEYNLELIDGFLLYLATSASGNIRSQVGPTWPPSNQSATFPADIRQNVNGRIWSHALVYAKSAIAEQTTPGFALATGTQKAAPDTALENFTHVAIYTRSNLVEQSVPATFSISDSFALVTALAFIDEDLDGQEFGGDLTWQAPASIDQITHYATYLADEVYSMSALYEQSTPEVLEINDTVAKVNILSFTDQDLDEGQLGGNISWRPPQDTSQVTHYRAYLAEDAAGHIERSPMFLETPVGTNQDLLPTDSTRICIALHGYLVRFLSNPKDTDSSVSAVNFTDRDLDAEELGGLISWAQPEDASLVTHFLVYLAEDQQGSNRSQVSEVGTDFIDVPVDFVQGLLTHIQIYTRSSLVEQTTPYVFPQLNYTQVLVYTRSVLAEQTSPAVTEISDTFATVQSPNFTDQDLDEEDLGGTLSWLEPADNARSAWYVIYLSTDAGAFIGRSHIHSAPAGTNFASLAPETDIRSFSEILVFTRSTLTEQTTPRSFHLSDFVDEDLDVLELGGEILWTKPLDDSFVTFYDVYLGNSSMGAFRSQLGLPVPRADLRQDPAGLGRSQISEILVNESLRAFLRSDQPLSQYTDVLVYSESSLAEQTTPVALKIYDAESLVINANFTDQDLDGEELGGTVEWQQSGDYHLVVAYDLYLARSASGVSRSRLNESLASDVFRLDLAPELPLDMATHVVIYTRSSLVEQTTPVAINISDADWNVQWVSFYDMDLDGGQLGGGISWAAPAELTLVTHYVAYLAANASGDLRSQIGSHVPVGTNYVDLPPETPMDGQGWKIRTITTPTSMEVNDTSSSVSNIVFVDNDLDEMELGGNITWSTPVDSSQVTLYSVYLSTSFDAENRSIVAEDVSIGTNTALLPAETAMRDFAESGVARRLSSLSSQMQKSQRPLNCSQ